jgi:peptide deformylase
MNKIIEIGAKIFHPENKPPLPIVREAIITDPQVLKHVSKVASWEEVRKLHLKERLIESLKGAWAQGAGLAAIQIGIPLRYAYVKIPAHLGNKRFDQEIELLNPEIVSRNKPTRLTGEGCLSIPKRYFQTSRYLEVIIKNDEKLFSSSGFEVFVMQHEIDHMNGILVSDIALNKYSPLGRNDFCGCGSGKKYKKCCLRT